MHGLFSWCTDGLVGCMNNFAIKYLKTQTMPKPNHGSGTPHGTTASPKLSFKALCKVGDTVVGRGNAGWTTSRMDIPDHTRTTHMGFLQKRLEDDICWIILHVPTTTLLVKGLNWTEPKYVIKPKYSAMGFVIHVWLTVWLYLWLGSTDKLNS